MIDGGYATAAGEPNRSQLARECQRLRPRQEQHAGNAIASYRKDIRFILDGRRTSVEPEMADLLARILGKPADYFVKPQQRLTIRRLQEELQQAREELARYRERHGPLPDKP